jgi:hypothetical protein
MSAMSMKTIAALFMLRSRLAGGTDEDNVCRKIIN